MRVLLVHASDDGRGGGNIAMQRLHNGLRTAGVDSKILCKYKKLHSSESVAIPQGFFSSRLERRFGWLASRFGFNDIHCLSTFKIKRLPAYLDADIVDFHCIHGGFFNYLALPSLTADKPAVFTLHDMWPFTGHCTYSYDCDRWTRGCGGCPYPGTYPPIRRDNTRVEWRLKNWAYRRSNMAIVTPSRWMEALARRSMVQNFRIHWIPYGVDTDCYQPLDRARCRAMLGIPERSRVLMFAAMKLNDATLEGLRKGGDLLVSALAALPEALKGETVLLLLGDGGTAIADAAGIPTLDLGYVSNDRLKAMAYSAADLFICPTRADNLPLVLLESMACGTPIVAFRVGGVADAVRPGVTGYLAEPENPEDLASGITQLLEDEKLRANMSRRCRTIAEQEYPIRLQVERYVGVYRELLQQYSGSAAQDSVEMRGV